MQSKFDITGRSSVRCLRAHAKLVTTWCEAARTMYSMVTANRPNREEKSSLPALGGKRLGTRGMVKATESSLKIVTCEGLKMLKSPNQNGECAGLGTWLFPNEDVVTPVERRYLTLLRLFMWNVVSPYFCHRAGESQEMLWEVRVWDAGKSEGRSVMDRIRVQTLPKPERVLTSKRVSNDERTCQSF